ncbi:MAG TPA: metalloregulator ArsR/SmtB family transcription factor [Pseudonocardia sp.]|jgi:DNA-binding transcriptional ArsR family regulator|nr:metalloregulator ArsR/SmtB family transcription factor [Pseudonocardia sp.]
MYARDDDARASPGQQERAGPDDEPRPGPDLPPGAHVEAAAESFRMLADPTRLRLLWLLRDGEHDVTGLAAAVGAARPAVSQHLAKLRMTGLVSTHRDGRRVLYSARGGHVRRLLTEALEAAGHRVEGVPDHD